MKIRSLLFSALCMLMVGSSFTSCSDDDDDDWKKDEGSKVELPRQRVFNLCQGSYQNNNALLTFYAPNHETATIQDIFYEQNNAKLGDTGQHAIEYNDNIYISMYGSRYVCRLNAAGVEQARYAFTEEQGQPRFLEAEDGKLYVTLSSGHVARLDAATLSFEKMVKVGNNPEHLVEEDDKLYVVNSGFGYDNRLSIIDLKTFDKAEHVEIIQNPQDILEANDQIFIQGYGGAYPDYTNPVVIYDRSTKACKEIGKGTYMSEYDDVVYVIYSETDYSTGTSEHTLYSYDARTNKKNEKAFIQLPTELKNDIITGFGINPHNGDFYVGGGGYTNNGDVYRFKKDGTFIEKYTTGVNPTSWVFLD